MKEITFDEYLGARELILAYEKQRKNSKESYYKNMTETNIVLNHTFYSNYPSTFYWLSIDNEIPNDRDAEGYISNEGAFHTVHICGHICRITFPTHEKAYKHMIKSFKRKGFIGK